MIDQTTIDRIQLLHPRLRAEVDGLYRNEIVPALTGRAVCRFAFTLRTFEEQAALYAQGRTKLFDGRGNKLGRVTNARAGQSMHNYGLAIDIVLIREGSAAWDTVQDFDGDGKADWMEVIDIFKRHGWQWGGDWESFKDLPHVEKTFGHGWQSLLNLYNARRFVPGTSYVNI